jgi:hypothetical protein
MKTASERGVTIAAQPVHSRLLGRVLPSLLDARRSVDDHTRPRSTPDALIRPQIG